MATGYIWFIWMLIAKPIKSYLHWQNLKLVAIRMHWCGFGLDWIGLDWIALNWVELDWTGLNWIELHWICIEFDWVELDWIGLKFNGIALNSIRLDGLGLTCIGCALNLIGLNWIGLNWIELHWICIELDWVELDWICIEFCLWFCLKPFGESASSCVFFFNVSPSTKCSDSMHRIYLSGKAFLGHIWTGKILNWS